MSALRCLKKGEILFREGDASDAMYVIKSGKIAITKTKGNSEIILAELKPGEMLGEMAFFDNSPRSAGARAVVDSVVIELPFKALNAQYQTFPEWLKAIVRTVNNHLRNANQKIKTLEKTAEEEAEYFSPYVVIRLVGILGLVAVRYGKPAPEGGVEVPFGVLRRYTIQVFQQPTAKMERLTEMLQSFGYMKVEDLGEGRIRLVVLNVDFLIAFCDYYTDWIYKSEDKKITILEKEMPVIKALVHYGKKETPNGKGHVKVNLGNVQTDCLKELGFPFEVDLVNGLAEKKLTSELLSGEGGVQVEYDLGQLEMLYPYWELIHAFKKVRRN